MGKTAAIIQTRMGSTRLPGKVMMELCGKTVLEHVITRVKKAAQINEIIIATTTQKKDDIIAAEATRLGVKYFRGSEDDVLSRYYYAAEQNNVDIVVRITSDCPLIDPNIIDELTLFYKKNHYDIVTNAGIDPNQRTYPRGLDTEVFSFNVLENTFNNAKENYQREHVTPYIYEHSKKVYYYKNDTDYSYHRWTLDTKEDFQLIEAIYRYLYKGKHDFNFNDIIKLFKNMPELFNINAHIEQKKIN